jgi:NADPH:quinone reductase-like Zn-dependent oxidoreductase
MKAVIYTKYGPPNVVILAELPKPKPKPHDVLIRVLATTVTTADWRARSLTMPPGFGLMTRLVFFGAEVTGVCSSANLELVRKIGADKVIDYTSVDFATDGQICRFRPVIDRTYPLENAVEAHARVDTGRKRGNVVIAMSR